MDIAIAISSFFGGLLLGYLSSYLSQKGKNRAQLEDLERLETQKRSIQIEHANQIEELKKQHLLEVERRSFSYAEKRREFSKFFTLLDEFNRRGNQLIGSISGDLQNKLLEGMLAEDPNTNISAIVDFNSGFQNIFSELNYEHRKLISETNSVRLIASQELEGLLDKLEVAVEESTETATNLLKLMSTREFWQDPTIVDAINRENHSRGLDLGDIRTKIMNQMKKELNDI